MSRIKTSGRLLKASWDVLKADKELITLPMISIASSVVIVVSFIWLWLPDADNAGESGAGTLFGFFALYFVLSYITIFFNAALVHAANERLGGGDPTIKSALRGALSRAGKILPWAILSATVSIVLRSLEERVGALGRIVVGLIGLAWALVTFLVLPLIVIEGVGVREAVRRSKDLFKRTWGENVSAQIGFGLVCFIAIVPSGFLGYAGLTAASNSPENLLFPGIAIAVAVIWAVVVIGAISAMSAIYQTALYHFAAYQKIPNGYFSDETMSSAFKHRSKLKRRYPF